MTVCPEKFITISNSSLQSYEFQVKEDWSKLGCGEGETSGFDNIENVGFYIKLQFVVNKSQQKHVFTSINNNNNKYHVTLFG